LRDPLYLIRIWDGLSSFGGFIGAIVGALGWKYLTFPKGSFVPVRHPQPLPILPFDEVAMSAFPISFTLGRVGCALVHDHPGMLASPGAPFAVAWPLDENDGLHHVFGPLHVVWGSTTRYDLGLVELLFLIPFTLALIATWNKKWPLGTYTAIVALVYSPVRFALDFLRVREGDEGDIRYGALTFAQYSCIAFFLLGLYFVWKIRETKGTWSRDREDEVRAESSAPSSR
ncbi:MAG TPA: prolipoprotein diacylglyceryl transferase family protein, partial [Polyangiaceae bacterium]